MKFYMYLFYDFVVKSVSLQNYFLFLAVHNFNELKTRSNAKIKFSLNILQYDITDIKVLTPNSTEINL